MRSSTHDKGAIEPQECTPPAPEPPSSRAEGLLFLHGLESNPGSSLQTDEEAGGEVRDPVQEKDPSDRAGPGPEEHGGLWNLRTTPGWQR